jgi:toxin ParE1/3/4
MQIRWAENAHRDLVDIREYIARDSLYYARQFTERLIAAVERLTDHSRIGRRVPEADRDDVREILFNAYRIIYLLEPEQVVILAIVHGSRDLARQQIMPWDMT